MVNQSSNLEDYVFWSDEIKALNEAISEALKELDSGAFGLSLPQNVYNKLKAKGFTIKKENNLDS